MASNGDGNYSRSLDLEVKVSVALPLEMYKLLCYLFLQVLNIILFPVSIAASFVTLSWNTSQSLARDYILQVRPRQNPHGMASFKMWNGMEGIA